MKRKLVLALTFAAFVSFGAGICDAAIKSTGEKKKATVVKIVRNTNSNAKTQTNAGRTSQSKTVKKSVSKSNTKSKTSTKSDTQTYQTVGAKRAAQAAAKKAKNGGSTRTAESTKKETLAVNTVSEKKISSKEDTKSVSSEKMSSKRTSGGQNIDVGLLCGQSEVSLSCLADVKAEVDGKAWQTYKKGTKLTVSASGKTVFVNGEKAGKNVVLKPMGSEIAFAVKGNRYRGNMKAISVGQGGVTLVNALALEDSLLGVVPCEVSPSWHIDAIRAQAVAARTYALYHKNGNRSSGFDVTDDTYSQVYEGASAEVSQTTKAVCDTEGLIITSGGKPIDAVFHSNGGGYTENCENVWGNSVSYLQGVKEESDSVLDKAWSKRVSVSSFQKNLGIGNLKSISLSKLVRGKGNGKDRGVSGRVKTFTVKGDKKEVKTTGDKMQVLYSLPSTLFDIKISGKEVIFIGYGSGHGLGLSQWGAQAMAKKHGGSKDYYQKILMHYYTGTKITKVY